MDKGEKEGKKAIKSWGTRKVLRVKKEVEVNMRENGEREEDCYILDSDPNDSLIIDLSKLSISSDLDAADISVLAEKGQVACRDYPHSRHLCFNNPFEKTPHESYCELCYCFVCDRVAPCKKWYGVTGHCHAIDNFYWTCRRRDKREKKTEPTTNALIRFTDVPHGSLF